MKPVVEGWRYKLGQSFLEKDILRVVSFWHPKGNAWRDGFQWLVLSREEMQARLNNVAGTGKKPALRTITRAMAHLRDEGILIIEHHRHPFRSMRGPVWWIRPDMQFIEAEMVRRRQQRRRSTGHKLATTIIQDNSKQGTDGQDSAEPDGPSQSQPGDPFELLEDDEMAVQGLNLKTSKTKASDIVAIFSEKKGPEDYLIVDKPEVAHRCLRDACLAAGYPAPGSFSKKRGGQLKTMLTRFSEEGVGKEKVAQLIFFIASKWPEFTSYCKTTFNVAVVGTVPNHNALTQHAVEAAGFWQTYYSAKTLKVEKAGEHGSSLDQGF